MSKGTPSFGRHNKNIHLRCRRCGRHSYHKTKGRCSACGYPSAKMRKFNWAWKNINRARKK